MNFEWKDSELNDHLAALANNEMDYLSQRLKVSAEYFQKAADAGYDISLAIAGLVKAFNECNHVPTMEPIARAVTRYYLNAADFESLRKVVSFAPFGRYYIDAILHYGKLGKDVFLFKDAVLDFFHKEEYLVIEIVSYYLKKDTENRFEILLEAIYRHPTAKKKFTKFLEKAKDFEVDLAKALPYLLRLLKMKTYERDAASCLGWISELRIDIAAIYPELGIILNSKKNIAIRSRLCYSLSYFALYKKDWEFVDKWLSSKELELRLSCFHAVCNFLFSKSPKDSILFKDRLVIGILDKNEKVGNFVLSVVRDGLDKNRNLLPSDGILIQLVSNLNQLEIASQVREALYLLSKHSDKNASKILSLLNTRGNDPLATFVHKLVQGETECKTCSKIPTVANYSHQFLIPRSVLSLQKLEGSELRKCPNCDTYYTYYYEEEWDDMSHSETWIITRLSPYETLDALSGEKKEKYKQVFPRLSEELKQNISHPEKKIREEASSFYAKYLLQASDWLNLKILLANFDSDVIISTLKVIEEYPVAKSMQPLEEELKQLLEVKKVSYHAAKILTNYFLSKKEVASIEKFLQSEDQYIILAALQCLWLAKRYEPYDMNPHFTSLRKLTLYTNEEIRRYSHYALEQVTSTDDEASLEDIIFLLQRKEEKGKEEALSALQKITRLGKNVSATIPYIGKLLHKPNTRWYASETLKAFAQQKIDISLIYPDIEKELRNKKFTEKGDLIRILDMAFSYGKKSQDTIFCISPLLNQEEYRSYSIPFLEKLFYYNLDISPALENLRKAIYYKGQDSYRESAIKILTHYYADRGNWAEVRDLLTNEDKHIIGATLTVIGELLKKKKDISPVIDLIELHRTHPYWFVKDEARRIMNFGL